MYTRINNTNVIKPMKAPALLQENADFIAMTTQYDCCNDDNTDVHTGSRLERKYGLTKFRNFTHFWYQTYRILC